MKSLIVVLLATGSILAPRGPAHAERVRFYGVHPVTPRVHEGLCLIEGPHLHAYRPHKRVLYAKAGGHWHFIGDPTEFASESAPRHAYYGHHPLFWIQADAGRSYCFITGPHHHLYAPPAEAHFTAKADVHWFVGKHPRWYKRRGRRRIDRHYTVVRLARPTVHVSPPAGFVGFYAGPGGASVQAGIRAPSISVGVGMPSVGVVIGGGHAPGTTHVIYHDRHTRKVKRRRKGPPAHAAAWGYRGNKHKHKHKHKRKHKQKHKKH